MDALAIVGRTVVNSALTAILAVAVLAAGCVPPKNKTPKASAVTSAPAAPAVEPADTPQTDSPSAAPAAAAAPEDNPLSHTWQRLLALEGKSGIAGSVTIGNISAGIGEEVSSAKNVRHIEAEMEVMCQIRKPYTEAAIYLDAVSARIDKVDASSVQGIKTEDAVVASQVNKGRFEWRIKLAQNQIPPVSQKLRMYIEAPKNMDAIEIRLQRSFKKADGDVFNSIPPTPESPEAKRLIDSIKKELGSRVKSDVPWLGVGDCAAVMGEQKNGQCYPTDASWRLAKKRAAGLMATPWMEKIVLRVNGGAIARKKEEPAKVKPVETPKPVETVKPLEAPKPAKVAKPVEAPKPIEAAPPVEEPKPIEVAPLAEEPKPVEAPKPAEVGQPVEITKPAKTAKPAVAPKAQQEPAKKPAIKKDAVKPKVNKEGQPIFDLSDVLGK